METITVKKPSIPVMRKLQKGQQGTLTKGDDYEVVVSAEIAKKIKNAHDKGKGIRVKLEADAITEMEGKGAWSWLKKTTSKVGHAIGGATETVSKAVIGKTATKAIEKTGKIALGTAKKAAKTVGLALAKSAPQILKTGGAILGGMAGSAIAVETGQPELAPVAGFIGSQIGSTLGKDVGEDVKKVAVPVIRGKKKSTKKDGLPDKIPIPKKPKLPEPKDPKKPTVPDAYLGRDTSGRLKTFKTTTGAMIDAVPIETQFQGTGKAKKVPKEKKPPKEKAPSKKGTQEMKDKMAKLRAMRKNKMSGSGIVAEGSGEGLVAEGSGEGIKLEMEGEGRAYTREEWTKKLCEGENSLLEQKKKKIDERDAKKAATAKKSLNVRNPKKKAPEPAPEPTQAEINEYPTLMDSLIDKMKKLLKKIEQENNKFLGLPPLFSNKKEKKKFDLSKKKLTEELDKLNKEGRDRFGNLYPKEQSVYFKAKYGEISLNMPYEEWEKVKLDPYKYTEEKQYDPLYEKAKKILDDFGWSEQGITKEAPAPAPAPAKKAPEKKAPSVGLTEAEKKRLKQAKEHLANMDRMNNMGIMMDEDQREEIEGTIRDLERKMSGKGMSGEGLRLGEDPATYTPTPAPTPSTPASLSQSAQRPDHERGHHLHFRPSRFDAISGSRLIGRRHQAFHSQPHATHHMWKTTLGMPR